jgi:tryprostatin B 6-hydroxylase
VFRIAKNSRNYILAEQMFEKYGEFVRWDQILWMELALSWYFLMDRVGPNELITNSPEAVSAVLGISSKCTKAPWWVHMQFSDISSAFNVDWFQGTSVFLTPTPPYTSPEAA